MATLIERVTQNIAGKRLFARGQRVIVAVSGGVDSMVLLHILHTLAPHNNWALMVAHFNHRLRGRASDADQRFVERAATQLGLKCISSAADVKARARSKKISIEMSARELRHTFLARTARKARASCVALAHHADDQVELFFLRLFRGAGSEGLAGMKWIAPSPFDRTVQLARPLLNVTKAELIEFAQKEKIGFREDASNATPGFARNRIRLEWLPLLERKMGRGFERAILRAMAMAGAESDFIGATAQAWLKDRQRKPFDQLHVAVQRRVLHEQLLKSIQHTPEFELVEQLREHPGQRAMIAPGRVVWRDKTGMIFSETARVESFAPHACELLLKAKSGTAELDGCTIRWRRGTQIPVHAGEAGREVFDAKRVGSIVHLRHWRPGDRFQPIGFSQPVKLQDWFVNQKIPRPRRHELIIATNAEGEIFWVEGLRIGEHFKIAETTRERLEWRWTRMI